MMKLEHLFENYDLARKALESWPLDQPVLDEQLSRFRISSNGVYPFTFQEELCFLRLAPASEKLKQRRAGIYSVSAQPGLSGAGASAG